jgi:hypothetical protein
MAEYNGWEDREGRDNREQGEGNSKVGPGESRPEGAERRVQPATGEDPARIAAEHTDEYAGQGDWGRQASWGTFGNRADWRRDRDWENFGGDWLYSSNQAA